MYLNSHYNNITFQCRLHHDSICNFICSEALCPKHGLLCKECRKLDIHKHHLQKICTLQYLIDTLLGNLQGDNLNLYIQEIQQVQKTFWDLTSIFLENNIPSLFSLETILMQTKESFWNHLLFYSLSDFSLKIKELAPKNEQDKLQSLIYLLNSYKINIAQVLTNDIKTFLNVNLQQTIEEFKHILKPYSDFIKIIEKDFHSENVLQNLSQVFFINYILLMK